MKYFCLSVLVLGLVTLTQDCHAQGFARGTKPTVPQTNSNPVGAKTVAPPMARPPIPKFTTPAPKIPTTQMQFGGKTAYIGPNANQIKAGNAFGQAYGNPSGFQIKQPTNTAPKQPTYTAPNIATQQKAGQVFGQAYGNPSGMQNKTPTMPKIKFKGF